MKGVDRADQMLHYYPCSRKTGKWTEKLVFFLLQMATLNSFIVFKKNTTNGKYKKSKYKFKDFILDRVEKMAEPNKQCVEGEVSINEVKGETVASDSSAVTPPPATLKRPLVKDPADRLEGGLKIHRMAHAPASNKKKNGAMSKC
jgi:hypothetical protein